MKALTEAEIEQIRLEGIKQGLLIGTALFHEAMQSFELRNMDMPVALQAKYHMRVM